MYRIPIYKVMLVKDGTQKADTKTIKQPLDAHQVLASYLQGVGRENFVVLMVDTKHKVIGINTVSVGTLSQTSVHPREVFKPAILANTAAIILGHNHPSGDPTPSQEDIQVTKRLVEAGELLGISVLDHIITGEDKYFSMKEQGLI
jgi:DNA repair protein RadC